MSAANSATLLGYLIANDICTVQLCPSTLAYLRYLPNPAGNIFFAAVFGLLLLAQSALAFRYRTWTYPISMCAGLIIEVIGYVGRVELHDNPFSDTNFLIYIICLTIAPASFRAAVYLCLARLVIIYNETLFRLKPRTYTLLFITCDTIALILQATGGALAEIGDSATNEKNIMIAGLSSQVFSLLLFVVLALEFAWRAWNHVDRWAERYAQIREGRMFKPFPLALTLSTLTILTHSILHIAELSKGFDSAIANDEVAFMILEGGMISIACGVLTGLHAGPAFGGGAGCGEFSGKWLNFEGR